MIFESLGAQVLARRLRRRDKTGLALTLEEQCAIGWAVADWGSSRIVRTADEPHLAGAVFEDKPTRASVLGSRSPKIRNSLICA